MAKHERTLAAIFAEPTRANVHWADIESLFAHFGAQFREGRGSRVRVSLGRFHTVFHRPHPGKEAGKASVESARTLLQRAGIQP